MDENPFAEAYITEAAYGAAELLARYSFLPFRHLQHQVSRNANVILVGRKGVGKTMLLKIFDPDLMQHLLRSTSKEHQAVGASLPKATVGVYQNLASPLAKLGAFQGGGRSERWWRDAYGDFLNCILLRKALEGLQRLSAVSEWMRAAGHRSPFGVDRVAADLARALSEEDTGYVSVDSTSALMAHLDRRVTHWSRFVNSDPATPEAPSALLRFGVPLFHLVSVIRAAKCFDRPFRLFVLIDQYEHLYHHRSVNDFRPVINEAMLAASRGGTGVEFKIGSRPYAHDNRQLLDGDGRVEVNREFVEVDLDVLAGSFYRPFALELFEKRLRSLGGGVAESDGQMARSRLPELTALEEASRYAGNRPRTDEIPRHLTGFVPYWGELRVPAKWSRQLVMKPPLSTAQPLISVLAAIALTREFRDGRRFRLVPVSKCDTPELEVQAYAQALVTALTTRYDLTSTKPRSNSRRLDNFVRDVEAVALFVVASAYKNQRKVYAGIETLLRLSSHTALTFIDIMRACYELLLLNGGNPREDTIPPAMQSEAVYRISEDWYRQIPFECDYGQTLQDLVRGLGMSFRRVQLELAAPDPSPNGFSIPDPGSAGSADGDPRGDVGHILRNAVRWGVLEESVHQDKTRARPPRRKYYINRVLCPYFGLSEKSKKDPMYVHDVEAFVRAVLEGQEPAEISERVRRSRGADEGSVRRHQRTLF